MSVLVVAIYAPLRQLTFKTLQNSVNISKKKKQKNVSDWDIAQIFEVFEHVFDTLLPSGSDS